MPGQPPQEKQEKDTPMYYQIPSFWVQSQLEYTQKLERMIVQFDIYQLKNSF